jgi:serine/threonine-protein kinase
MPNPQRKPVQAGDVIGGKYRVERTLGEGGIGVVVRARHLELGFPVAIKVLLAHDDGEQVARFMREARASVRIRSEHVARVTDVGRLANGTPYMVMELLEGEDLGALAERGPLPVADAAALLLQACEGIAAAHALGIVHRDVKPRNLFLTRSAHGRPLVKVLDFGLARAFDGAGADARLTASMTIAGSPPYMSPEQVRALRDVDVRSDFWSLGVSFYELLTSRTPFESATVAEICARILRDPPTPIGTWIAEPPPAVTQLLDRCLAKDREARFQSLDDLTAALEALAPPECAGTAARVRDVLSSPMPADAVDPDEVIAPAFPADGDTRTAFNGDRARTSRRAPIAAAIGGAACALAVGVVADAIWIRATAEPTGAADAVRPPTEPVVLPPPSAGPPAPVHDEAGTPAAGAHPSPRSTGSGATPPSPARRPPKASHPESTRM